MKRLLGTKSVITPAPLPSECKHREGDGEKVGWPRQPRADKQAALRSDAPEGPLHIGRTRQFLEPQRKRDSVLLYFDPAARCGSRKKDSPKSGWLDWGRMDISHSSLDFLSFPLTGYMTNVRERTKEGNDAALSYIAPRFRDERECARDRG